MNISKFFQLGMGLTFMAFMSTAVFNETQAQCGSSTGPNIVTVAGGFPCSFDVTINHTGLGGSITCFGLTGSSLPYDITIPTSATVTSVTVNGYTATSTYTCHAAAGDECMGACLVFGEIEIMYDGIIQELQVN